MKYLLLALIAFSPLFPLTAMSDLDIEADVEIEVCSAVKQSTITIFNNSGGVYTNPLFTIELPTGIEYLDGSISELTNSNVLESNVTNNSALEFSADDLSAGDSIKFVLSYSAGIGAIDYQQNGGVFRNAVLFQCDEDSILVESNSYNILYPVMSVLGVSPTSQTFVSGSAITGQLMLLMVVMVKHLHCT